MADALIHFVRDRLQEKLLEDYEELQQDAMELSRTQCDNLLDALDQERNKRSHFQYEMPSVIKKAKAITSLERAKEFTYQLEKLM